MITSLGVGSGLDINGLLTQLLAAERQPVTFRLDRKEVGLQAELSALGSLKSALAEFRTAQTSLADIGGFNAVSINADDTELFTATGDSDASIGKYSVEVTNLAQSQKLASKAFSSTTEAIGSGTLNFRFGTYDSGANSFTTNAEKPAKSVVIDPANSSLQGIRDAVNEAEIGVNASIIDDGTGKRLVFSTDDTGASNGLQITVSGDSVGDDVDDSGLSQLAYDPTASAGSGKNLTETVVAEDAQLIVDGLTISRPSNSVSGMIEGVTLELHKEDPGKATILRVENDNDATFSATKSFVDAYNTLQQSLNTLTSFDEESDIRGPLLGDSAVRGIESQVRRLLGSPIQGLTGALVSPADAGIETQQDGTLVLDETKLKDAIDKDTFGVARLFADAGATSDSLSRFSGFTKNSVAGNYAVTVTQLATQGQFTGSTMSAFPLTVDTDNDEFTIRIDGTVSGSITLTQGAYADGDALAAEVQSRINGDTNLNDAGHSVAVSFVTDHLEIVSSQYGSVSKVEVLSVDTNSAASLGLSIGGGTDGVDVVGTIGGIDAAGSGRTLTGKGDASGIAMDVLGGALGDRGTLSFSHGMAAQLRDLMDTMLGADSLVELRIDGLNDRISSVGDDRAALDRRMERIESRLVKQFTSLDTLLGSLQSTSSFLTQQLAALPGPRQIRNN